MNVTDAAFHVCPNFVLKLNTVGESCGKQKEQIIVAKLVTNFVDPTIIQVKRVSFSSKIVAKKIRLNWPRKRGRE